MGKLIVKIKILATLILFTFVNCMGQDSVFYIIKNLNWKDTVLSEGVKWQYVHTRDSSLFRSRQNIHLLRLKKLQGACVLEIARTHPLEGTLTSELAKKSMALAAVNASFFNIKTGQSVNWIKENGTTKDTSVINNGRYSTHQEGIFAFEGSDGLILKRDTSMGKIWENSVVMPNVIESGPLLLLRGQRQPLKDNAFNMNRHPRTCVCITEDEILLLTADGRSGEAYGLSLVELTEILLALGCKDALNFDGGGSTTMYIRDAGETGVVNMPCDNKTFDHGGERKVCNALIIKKY